MSDGKSFGITPLTAKFTLAGQGVAVIADESKKVGLSDFNGGRSRGQLPSPPLTATITHNQALTIAR
jgi:hypothetical protein